MYIKKILAMGLLLILSACNIGSQQPRDVIISDGNKILGASCQPGDYSCHQSSTQSGLTLQQLEQKNHKQQQDIFYPAPDFIGLSHWLNSDGYDSLTQLQGQLVLVDFWNQSCSKCIHAISYLNQFYERYGDQGLEIIGIHAPSYSAEQRFDVFEDAVLKHKIDYPVVQDNNFMTWKAYKNRYWPAYYLIDTQGNVRFEQFGQGSYDDLEQAIQELLPNE